MNKIGISPFLAFLSIFFLCGLSRAQSNTNTNTGQNTTFLGAKTGALLPSGIEGVRETLPMWGLKFGHAIGETLSLEYDVDAANAKGINYYLAYFSLRHDFTIGDALPLFALIGVDAHYFKRRDSYGEITGTRREYDFRFSSGWHLGVGTETKVYGNLYGRADFRMGFSPGRQLVVTIGGVYRF
jgi:opacity protein-like surface antigen